MATPAPTPSPCRLCTLLRGAWQVLRLALLPRTLAFIGALGVLALMAPSSIPPLAPIKRDSGKAPPSAATMQAAPPPAAATDAASAAPGAADAAAGSQGAAVAPADPAASTAPVPTRAATTAPIATAAPLRFRPVTALPSARVGVRWGPHALLESGQQPYVMSFVGQQPAWLTEFDKGTLSGTPDKAGSYTFTLQAHSQADPAQRVTQTFRVFVAAPPRRQELTELKRDELTTEPGIDRDLPVTWRLEADDLKALADLAATQAAQAALAAGQDPAEVKPVPTAKQLQDMFAPLLGVDYPSEAHFRKVLGLAHCHYYRQLLLQVKKERLKEAQATGVQEIVVKDKCPPDAPAVAKAASSADAASAAKDAATSAAPSDSVPLARAFHSLMPSEDAVVRRARKVHAYSADFVSEWTATEGCGCVPPQGEDVVYGFVSYWGTAEQQQATPPRPPASAASGVPPPPHVSRRRIDFSLFTRLSYFGAVLNDLGELDLTPEVNSRGHRLALEAQRHGTRVDLVVHRNHWDTLLAQPRKNLERLAARAAENTVRLVDAPQMHLHEATHALLLPFWREEAHAYSGVTVFFDRLPPDGSEAAASFSHFHKAYVAALVAQMRSQQQLGRRAGGYRLNIVVPADRMAEQGLFTFEDMVKLIREAEPPREGKGLEAKERRGQYTGTTDITVDYIVLLPDPTTATKKDLRARLDQSATVTGPHRVVLLESLVPMLLRPFGVRPLWASDDPERQFRDDLAYMRWSYAGVTLWELPGLGSGDPERFEKLAETFRHDKRRLRELCDFVCPRRVALRLALQALLVLGVLSISAWLFSCSVRTLGLPYKIFLWLGGFVTVPLALALLECDPALQALPPNLPLIVLSAAVFIGGLYLSFKKRRARP